VSWQYLLLLLPALCLTCHLWCCWLQLLLLRQLGSVMQKTYFNPQYKQYQVIFPWLALC
jgi:hypothetical protein